MIEEILYEEDSGKVGMYYEPKIGYMITLVLTKWSVDEFKRYLSIFNTILHLLKQRGIDEVFAMCDTENRQKFTELFGFSPTDDGAMCLDNVTRRIMRRYT